MSVNASGFLNFLVYGLDNKDFRKHYSIRYGFGFFLIAPLYLIGVSIAYIYKRINFREKIELTSDELLKEEEATGLRLVKDE